MVWNMTRATTFSAIINSFSVFCLYLPSNLNWIFWNYEMFKIKKKAWQLVAQSAPFIVTSSFLQKMSVNMISLVDFYVWFFFSLTHSSNIAAICSSFPPPRTGSLHFFLIFSLICIFLFISSTQVALFIFFVFFFCFTLCSASACFHSWVSSSSLRRKLKIIAVCFFATRSHERAHKRTLRGGYVTISCVLSVVDNNEIKIRGRLRGGGNFTTVGQKESRVSTKGDVEEGMEIRAWIENKISYNSIKNKSTIQDITILITLRCCESTWTNFQSWRRKQ